MIAFLYDMTVYGIMPLIQYQFIQVQEQVVEILVDGTGGRLHLVEHGGAAMQVCGPVKATVAEQDGMLGSCGIIIEMKVQPAFLHAADDGSVFLAGKMRLGVHIPDKRGEVGRTKFFFPDIS